MPISIGLAAVILGAVALVAVFPGLAPHNPGTIDSTSSLAGPSGSHLLGTDQLGRDVFSRVIAGARTAVLGPLILTIATTTIATVLALVAGYFKGWADVVISRAVDVVYSVPATVVAIVIVGVTGGGWWLALSVLTVFSLPVNVRFLRAAVLSRAELPYIEAARTSGLSEWRIVLRHLLPAISPFVVTAFFLRFTYGIVDLSSLSFLGLGVPPGSSDWGRMIAENRSLLAINAWTTIAPALALVAVAVSTNTIGDWLHARWDLKDKTK